MQQVYQSAGQAGVLFTPGSLFSLEGRWDNCLRLSAGYYTRDLEPQIETLGRIIDLHWEFS